MPDTKAKPVHIAGYYKVGDRVKVLLRVQDALNWGDNWGGADMDESVGKVGEVIAEGSSGIKVRFERGRAWFYPSCALSKEGNVTTAAAPATSQTKKTRVRVKPGPWDQAPCTHLRWQLMGFFREKLAVVKTTATVATANGTITGTVESIDIACTKCDTKMTLKAK